MSKEFSQGVSPIGYTTPNFSNEAEAETRRKAITRFALDFLKANVEALEDDGMLYAFGGTITENEIDALKNHLGVKFS